MLAAVHTRYGPPDVVQVRSVDQPAAKDGELLVRVHATTVNRTDCGMRAAKPVIMRLFAGLRRPRLHVLGNEFAGEVETVGGGVTTFAVGDRVFGFSGSTYGAHAEYLAVPAEGLVATIPAGLGYEQAAPATEGWLYARSLLRSAQVQAGQDILVNGATGTIGSATIQLLRLAGARVTAVCGTDHLELVKGLGADRVIDYTAEDFTKDGQRYEAVLDAVGKSLGRCRRLLKPRGVYVSSDLGPLSQNPLLALLTPRFRGRRVRFPIPKQERGLAQQLAEQLAAGSFVPLVDRQYPLAEIVAAYRYVETGQKIGSVVLTVPPPA